MKFKHTVNLLLALSCLSATAQQGQLYDNTNYKAIYFKEACDLIANTPGLLLLDVRSPGEYADTSQFIGSRIGRLKGAINISIDSILLHYRDLVPYKNRTILVYCSHSQRSRGVSRLLGDSGFTKVYSLNGGMTEVDREPDASFPCKASLYTSNLPYRLMGPEDAAVFIKDKNNVIIDIRPATQFNGTDTAEMTNIGRIKGAINIPGTELDQSIAGLEKYKDRPILLYDLYTSNAMKAAARLTAAGFKKVAVLFNGFDTFLLNFSSASPIRKEWIMAAPRYQLTGVREAVDLVNHSPSLVVADMRAIDQFENKSKQKFFNLGHIRNAVNFQNAQQLEDYLKGKPKNTPVLIYGAFGPAMSSMNTDPVVDLPALSRRLAGEGYTRIHLLYAGIYSLVWASANVDGQQDAKGILIDHEGLY
ncbi:MAG TPA: rhodanese-like domain-containing protein [Puia sp.]|jgi:rhodanese-related sulfurtransferase|nr:rhodanese-like domain-containing protein [Puia sp.]